MLPWIWYFLPSSSTRPGYWLLPSVSHLGLKPGTSSSIGVSTLGFAPSNMAKKFWFPQMILAFSMRNTTIGRGKFISVLFFALSAS